MKTTTIIGGGAAGMMAAATICESDKDAHVVLIEKNARLGQKVAMTGGGRCNVTTGLNDIKEVLTKYPRGSRFLRYAMYEFPPEKMCEWIENHNVPLKTEEDMRVFPKSDKGDDIVGVFEEILRKSKAKILLKNKVKQVTKKGNKFLVDGMESDNVIITIGGEGHQLIEPLGHKITDLAASLSPFKTKEEWTHKLAGVSFQKAKLRIKKHEFTGPILLTHQGITGPAVFAISALAAYEDLPMTLFVDFLPDLNQDALREELNTAIKNEPQKLFQKILGKFVTKSFAKEMSDNRTCAEIGKKDINKAVETIKNTQLTITGYTTGKEFVTAGGVDLREVDSKTMESKICPGLYFAGEVLDIDAFTGGFNLQAAWATGRLAGKNV